MAKITYICDGEENGTARIVVDSVVVDSSNFVGVVDSKVHAIQWDGSSGEIEYKDNTPNEVIKDISSYGFEDKHATEKNAQEDAEAEAEAKAKADAEKAEADAKAKWTYAEKRANEYPSFEDQLDDIYHNGIDGWKTTIKAVKDKYPK